MKLTTTDPDVLELLDIPGGLRSTRRRGDSRPVLIVKASRELAQTANLRDEFRFYLVPIHVGDVATCGLLAAFFDDYDQPLGIRTPLFSDESTRDLLSLLSSDSFFVHFFDERNRELLGFRAENPDAHRVRSLTRTMRFVPETPGRGRQVLDDMQVWFGTRSPSDDADAFTIDLQERLFPDDLAEHVENPGDLNEPDIAAALHRPFGPTHVFENPLRADNGREFVDVLVTTSKTLLLIQAKDSPSTESALNRKVDRKKATSAKQVRKAAGQLKGAINHLNSCQPVELITDGRRHLVSMSGHDVFGLVIVKELFDPKRPDCSRLVLAVSHETGTSWVLLDHTEFQELAFFRTTEEGFVVALQEMFVAARSHGAFPRSRFGVRVGKTVVYQPHGTGKVSNRIAQGPVRPVQEESHVTPPQPLEDPESSEPADTGFRADFGPRHLPVVVDRQEVEALDVSRPAALLSRVLADRNAVERYQGAVDLAFLGYSDDPRELHDIAEVRRFFSKLDAAFPYWFYFVSTDGLTLGLIARCLCSVTRLRPGVFSLGPDLIDFVTRHYGALNWLFDNYSLDKRQNFEISRNVAEYFGKFEPIR